MSFKAPPESFKGLSFDPPERTDYRPGFLERLREFRPSDGFLWGVAGCAMLLALLLLARDFGQGKGEKKPSLELATSVQVEGALAASPPPGSKIVLSLPAIPLREIFPVSEVLREDRTYLLKAEFRSARQPVSAEVLLTSEGMPLARSGLFELRGTPLQGRAPDLRP
jgi:hypothetical protein